VSLFNASLWGARVSVALQLFGLLASGLRVGRLDLPPHIEWVAWGIYLLMWVVLTAGLVILAKAGSRPSVLSEPASVALLAVIVAGDVAMMPTPLMVAFDDVGMAPIGGAILAVLLLGAISIPASVLVQSRHLRTAV
jgi:hypothetical protein